MNILIVGAGFGGLAAAAHLRRDGHAVTIIEKKAAGPYHGFVLGLWRNGLHTLRPFGVIERIESPGFAVIEERIRDKTGKLLATMDYRPLIERYGPVFLLHHADMYSILQELCTGIPILYETQVRTVKEQSHCVHVTFSSGQEADYDLVVGADGLHSPLRTSLFGMKGITYTGVRLWFQLLPAGILSLAEPTNLYGEGEYACLLPTRNGQVGVLFLATMPDEQPEPPAERLPMLNERFADFTWGIPEVLHSLHDPLAMASYPVQQVTLERWHKRRVVLLGDAAHAVSPTTTMGCAMALEDAHVLAEELRLSGEDQVEQALASYTRRRQARVEQIRHISDFLLWWTSMKAHGLVFLRNLGMHFAPPATLLHDMEKIIDSSNDV